MKNTNKYDVTALTKLLNPTNTISANRYLAHSIGMTETIIYSALISKHIFYSKNDMLLDGYFYSTISDLEESTTFGVKAQKSAIKHLMEHGLIECEFKGMPAKRYFRIIDSTDKLIDFIKEGTEISRKIVSAAKEHNAEKRGTRNEDISENQAEANIDENTENPCSYPSAGTCPRPAAGTCSDLPHGKTKDNIKPNVDNFICYTHVMVTRFLCFLLNYIIALCDLFGNLFSEVAFFFCLLLFYTKNFYHH